jgi:hypothetical protein
MHIMFNDSFWVAKSAAGGNIHDAAVDLAKSLLEL